MSISVKRSVLSIICILLVFTVLTRCIKEEFDPDNFDASLDLKSGMAIPIGFSHLAFEEYLTDSLIGEELKIGEDGFLYLCYNAPIDLGVMGDILSINDAAANTQLLNQTGSVIFLDTPGASLIIMDSVNIPIVSTQVDARIDSIQLLSGTIQIDVNSSNLTGSVTFLIDGLRQNGILFSATRNLSDPDFSLPLNDYSVVPEHDISGNDFLKCIIFVTLQPTSGPVAPGGTIIDFRADLTDPAYQTIYGDFEGYTIDFPLQTIPTPFFNQLIEGEILFADPKFKLFFSNSVGVPFGIFFRRIEAIDRNNIGTPLTGSGVPLETSPKMIKYPSLSQAGETINDSLVIDRNNSNLPDFIAASPESIMIEGSAMIAQLVPPATTFIRYDSEYKITSAIDLPLWGKADFIILLDTLDFDYLSSSLPPPEEIEKLVVRTSITNSFPITAYPQIYLLDENRVLIDSLFTGSEMVEGASDTNGDGIADPAKQDPIDIDLPRSRIDNLMDARYILIKGSIMTTDFPSIDVKLYSTYFLDYNVGIIAQLKIQTGK